MVFLLGYYAHRRDCRLKQRERANAIASLPHVYRSHLSPLDADILNTPVADLAERIRTGAWLQLHVLRAYGKRAIQAHTETNCLTEVMLASADFDVSQSAASEKPKGSLAGVPVSLKDTTCVAGYDACMGYSKLVGQKAQRDSAIVRLLKDAGAVPYVKTNIPVTLLSFESTNDVFGRTTNPFNKDYSPGGSSGGESALLAFGGSRIGIGTDVAGSVRIPAHYSGIYSIRCSTGRIPKSGNNSTMGGQEGIPAIASPMTRTLPDLGYFLKAIVDMKPWEYDHTCHPIPWRGPEVQQEMEKPNRKITWGVLWSDGVVDPSPACRRALQLTVDALAARGDTIVELASPPNPYNSLRTASILLNNDGGATFSSLFRSSWEWNDPGVARFLRLLRMPRLVVRTYAWLVRHVWRDPVWAGLLERWYTPTTAELWAYTREREQQRLYWHAYWEKQQFDYVLCVPNACPAVPGGGMAHAFASCGYTFLWNLLDYSAGVMPVTNVDPALDAVPKGAWKRMPNAIAKGAYRMYDAERMRGLPVGVQIVGKRLEEEKVFWGMERVQAALDEAGVRFEGIEVKAG